MRPRATGRVNFLNLNELMKQPIDIERCLRGMKNLEITGNPQGRFHLIEEAILAIGTNPDKALKAEYIGVKNYAHFGDQRSDHPYGYGPSHGYIVFSIGRVMRGDPAATLGPDEIYLLECVRDFGTVDIPVTRDNRTKDEKFNLCRFLNRLVRARADLSSLEALLNEKTVEVQAP